MTLRRAIAFSAAVMMLHLGYVAREFRCTPEHDATQPTSAPSEHHQQHSEQQSAPPAPPAPPIPVCCQALTSCAVTVDVTSAVVTCFGGSTTARPLSAAFNPLATHNSTPDAPPPRA